MDLTTQRKQQDLPIAELKFWAKKIRGFIEPDGAANSQSLISEIELRKFLLKEGNIQIKGTNDIVSILKTNYSENTITRLVSKIKKSIVWDSSICGLPTEELFQLISNNDTTPIITSLTFWEFKSICNNPNANEQQRNNAHFLSLKVLENSDTFNYVDVLKTGYVDTDLLKFCSTHSYGLYTRDIRFGLRARCFKIPVKIFSNSPTPIEYSPNGKNIILDTDVFQRVSLEDIILTATSIGAGKIIVTYDFIEYLEKHKGITFADKFTWFFLNNEGCTIYLHPSESESLIELSKKYDATIFTASIEHCLDYKKNYCDYYYVLPQKTKEFITNMTEQYHAPKDNFTTSNTTVENIPEKTTTTAPIPPKKFAKPQKNIEIHLNETPNTTILLPHINCRKKSIYMGSLSLHEKMWILDETGNEIAHTIKPIEIQNGYTVIYGKNNLNDYYHIDVYEVMSNCISGKKIYHSEFVKGMLNCIEPKYKDYAIKLISLT